MEEKKNKYIPPPEEITNVFKKELDKTVHQFFNRALDKLLAEFLGELIMNNKISSDDLNTFYRIFKKSEITEYRKNILKDFLEQIGLKELYYPLIEKAYSISHKLKVQEYGNVLSEILSADIIDFFGLARQFIQMQPLLYTDKGYWWAWNHHKKCWEMTDETDILLGLKIASEKNRILRQDFRTQFFQALEIEARAKWKEINKMEEESGITNRKKRWIQFKDKIVDIDTGEMFDASPEYFITNPIPWRLGDSEETPIIDSLFEDWVGEEYKKLLYEIIAYAMIPHYPIAKLFCLLGSGRNGKSTYLRLIRRFLGTHNCTSSSLDQLMVSQFERAKLYKKLVCFMGETNFTTLKQTDFIKALTGQDMISAQFKFKKPFDFVNYAKIIIATNNLPVTLDRTDAYYSRWVLLQFPNQFPETGKDILDDIPEAEYERLARKCLRILKELLEKGQFHKEGTIREKEITYEKYSNPLLQFLDEKCIIDADGEIPFFEFYDVFLSYLKDRGLRKHSRKEVSRLLKAEGFETKKKHFIDKDDGKDKVWTFILGLRWREDIASSIGNEGVIDDSTSTGNERGTTFVSTALDDVTNVTDVTQVIFKNIYIYNQIESRLHLVHGLQKPIKKWVFELISFLLSSEKEDFTIIEWLKNKGLEPKTNLDMLIQHRIIVPTDKLGTWKLEPELQKIVRDLITQAKPKPKQEPETTEETIEVEPIQTNPNEQKDITQELLEFIGDDGKPLNVVYNWLENKGYMPYKAEEIVNNAIHFGLIFKPRPDFVKKL